MGYPSYSEYQESKHKWLGKIPGHWGSVVLKRKFHIVNGSTPKSSEPLFWDGDIVWITPADFDSAIDGYIHTSSRMITNDGLSSCGTTLVPEKSVVVTTRAPIGRIAQAGSKLCTNQGCKTLVRDSNDLIERFIFYTLVASGAQLNALGLGTTFMELSKDDLGYYPVALPSPTEQQKIADFLDWKTGQIDGLIAKKKQLIEKLKEKRIALITQAVTKGLNPDAPRRDSGISWLGEVPENWEVKRLKFSSTEDKGGGIQIGPFGGMLTDVIYSETGEFKLYGQENILSGDFEKGTRWLTAKQYAALSNYWTKIDDVLFTRKGSIGGCAVFPSMAMPGIIDSDTIRLRVNTELIEIRFLLGAFRYSAYMQYQVQQIKRGAILSGLNTSTIANLQFVSPPLPEQIGICEFLDREIGKIDALELKVERAIDRLTEYRTALITAATTGKIDVRKVKMGGVA